MRTAVGVRAWAEEVAYVAVSAPVENPTIQELDLRALDASKELPENLTYIRSDILQVAGRHDPAAAVIFTFTPFKGLPQGSRRRLQIEAVLAEAMASRNVTVEFMVKRSIKSRLPSAYAAALRNDLEAEAARIGRSPSKLEEAWEAALVGLRMQ